MKFNLTHAAVLVASATFAMSASAADLPRKSVAPAFTPVPASNWTGFYVGINGGWGQSAFKDKDAVGGDTQRAGGGLIGATLGYNHQFSNNVVVGLEADYAFSFINKKQTFSDVVAGFGRFDETSKIETTGFGTLRGRLGYAFGNFMPYLTGGLAIASNKFEFTDQFFPLVGAAGPLFTTKGSGSHVGWTVGLGAEYMLTQNWTVKGEYLYANLGDKNYTFTSSNGFTSQGKLSQDMHIIRAGLNYKF